MTSSNDLNEMIDKAPQINSIAARLETLAERRSKLKEATAAEQAEIEKLRQAEADDMKAKAQTLQSKFTPQSMFSGGMPDMAKMQKFRDATMRLTKANMAFMPERFSGAAAGLMGGGMPPGFGDSSSAGGPAGSGDLGTLPAGAGPPSSP